jgi:hypothetical protein
MAPQLFENLLAGSDSVDSKVKTDFAILKAEVTVGLTLTTSVVAVIKLVCKAFTGGAEGSLEAQKQGPSGFFDLFGIVVDIVNTIIALPENDNLPGANERQWVGPRSLHFIHVRGSSFI